MVKIRDLTNPQLLQQISKYQGIIEQLVTEREDRIKSGTAKPEDVLTEKELAAKSKEKAIAQKSAAAEKTSETEKKDEAAPVAPLSADEYQVSFDDAELTSMEEKAREAEKPPEEDEDQIRVTQLLTLNKDQMAELKENAKKIKKKNKK